jgi:hypothetical protein
MEYQRMIEETICDNPITAIIKSFFWTEIVIYILCYKMFLMSRELLLNYR